MPRNLMIVRTILITDILFGAVIAAWSRWRWYECGYDCELFESINGITAIVGWYVGLGITAVSVTILLVIRKQIPGKK